MIIDFAKVRFFVRTAPTDFRKQINGLSVVVQEEMGLDPFKKCLFIFCNKRRNRLKILYWDNNGFWLFLKRLEKDKYPWPRNEEEVKEISFKDLKMLLSGIDFWNAHKKLNYKKVT